MVEFRKLSEKCSQIKSEFSIGKISTTWFQVDWHRWKGSTDQMPSILKEILWHRKYFAQTQERRDWKEGSYFLWIIGG